MNNSNWNESIFIFIGIIVNVIWKNNFIKYVFVSKSDNFLRIEGEYFCNGVEFLWKLFI